jgi:hypothetical protein
MITVEYSIQRLSSSLEVNSGVAIAFYFSILLALFPSRNCIEFLVKQI